jgi:hypothetical protein
VMKLPTVEDVPVLIERIAGMEPGEMPFHARSYYRNERLTIAFSE